MFPGLSHQNFQMEINNYTENGSEVISVHLLSLPSFSPEDIQVLSVKAGPATRQNVSYCLLTSSLPKGEKEKGIRGRDLWIGKKVKLL